MRERTVIPSLIFPKKVGDANGYWKRINTDDFFWITDCVYHVRKQ